MLLPKLESLAKVFEIGKFDVDKSNASDINDPFIFVKSNEPNDFDGVKIYFINDELSYRPQKKKKAFGKAYPLDLNGFFEELMAEGTDEQVMGKEIVDYLNQVLSAFFKKNSQMSKVAKKELQ